MCEFIVTCCSHLNRRLLILIQVLSGTTESVSARCHLGSDVAEGGAQAPALCSHCCLWLCSRDSDQKRGNVKCYANTLAFPLKEAIN